MLLAALTAAALVLSAETPATPPATPPPAPPASVPAPSPSTAPSAISPAVPAAPASTPAPTPAPASVEPTEPPAPPPPPPKPLLPFPHPLISEVLFAVPTGAAGDANLDGTRDATGDEFVELFNPHDRPISLRGYRLTDKALGKGNSLTFTFPDCTLKPGEVAVVFNGYKATAIPGPVGDSGHAEGPNPRFRNALVFSMKVQSGRQGFSNTGDAVLIYSPTGTVVQCIRWGKNDKLPDALLVEDAPVTSKSSVQRDGPRGQLAVHPPEAGLSFSPGAFGPPPPGTTTRSPATTAPMPTSPSATTPAPASPNKSSPPKHAPKTTPPR